MLKRVKVIYNLPSSSSRNIVESVYFSFLIRLSSNFYDDIARTQLTNYLFISQHICTVTVKKFLEACLSNDNPICLENIILRIPRYVWISYKMMNEITVNIPHTVILKLAENRLCSPLIELCLS